MVTRSIPCPKCDAEVRVGRDHDSDKVRCPECDALIRMPADDETEPPPRSKRPGARFKKKTGGTSPVLIAVLVGGGCLLLLGGTVAGALALAGVFRGKAPTPVAQTGPDAKTTPPANSGQPSKPPENATPPKRFDPRGTTKPPPQPEPKQEPPRGGSPAEVRARELALLEGSWYGIEGEMGGFKMGPNDLRRMHWTFERERLIDHGSQAEASFRFNSTAAPKTIDFTTEKAPKAAAEFGFGPGRTYSGIYEFSGDTLRVCYALEGGRPSEFRGGDKTIYVVMKRGAGVSKPEPPPKKNPPR